MPRRLPKLISPAVHRGFDALSLPGLIATALWMSRRDRTAGALVGILAAIEGTAFLTTDYGRSLLPWMSLRNHLRTGLITPAFITTLAFVLRDIRPGDRRIILGLLAVPLVLNSLTRDADADQPKPPLKAQPHKRTKPAAAPKRRRAQAA